MRANRIAQMGGLPGGERFEEDCRDRPSGTRSSKLLGVLRPAATQFLITEYPIRLRYARRSARDRARLLAQRGYERPCLPASTTMQKRLQCPALKNEAPVYLARPSSLRCSARSSGS